jgi:hypothetical protein
MLQVLYAYFIRVSKADLFTPAKLDPFGRSGCKLGHVLGGRTCSCVLATGQLDDPP